MQSCIEDLCDLINSIQHDRIGRNGSQQAWREALVETWDAALSVQPLHKQSMGCLSAMTKIICAGSFKRACLFWLSHLRMAAPKGRSMTAIRPNLLFRFQLALQRTLWNRYS